MDILTAWLIEVDAYRDQDGRKSTATLLQSATGSGLVKLPVDMTAEVGRHQTAFLARRSAGNPRSDDLNRVGSRFDGLSNVIVNSKWLPVVQSHGKQKFQKS